MAAHRVSAKDVGRERGQGRRHQLRVSRDLLGRRGAGRRGRSIGPVGRQVALTRLLAKQTDAVFEISIEMPMVLDQLDQAGVAEQGRALGTERVACFADPIDKRERLGRPK
jgi:hypothetical protein